MAGILLVHPDATQAGLLRRASADRLGVTMEVAETKEDAVCAITREVPDLVLISALLGPRDEETILTHLRAFDDKSRPRIVLVPHLEETAAPPPPPPPPRFAFRRKPQPAPPTTDGDLMAFVDELRPYLKT